MYTEADPLIVWHQLIRKRSDFSYLEHQIVCYVDPPSRNLTDFTMFLQPYKLHPSAALSRLQQAVIDICKSYLTALPRIDEHSAAVDDNAEFDENTSKEKQ